MGFVNVVSHAIFVHPLVDSKQHMQDGYCSERACTDIPVDSIETELDAKKKDCAYLHQKDKVAQDKSEHVKVLEVIINKQDQGIQCRSLEF